VPGASASGQALGNGLANLHNARKAQSPMVNIIGSHATTHQRFDAPLTSDVAGFRQNRIALGRLFPRTGNGRGRYWARRAGGADGARPDRQPDPAGRRGLAHSGRGAIV